MRPFALLVASIPLLAACGSSNDEIPNGAGEGGSGGTTMDGGGGGAAANGGATNGDQDAGPCAPVSSTDEAVQIYGSAWNEQDAEARLCLLHRSLVDDATYVDPTIDTATVEDLSQAIADFQTSFSGGTIVTRSGLDARDDELRFGWGLTSNGASVLLGEDYMELAADGRIASIRGYWEPYPDPVANDALDTYVAAWSTSDGAARETALSGALASGARLTGPGGIDATGTTEISAAMGALGATDVGVTGVQIYLKYARVALTLTLSGGTVSSVTDYMHLDADGKLTRIARFEGDLPPLP